MLRLQNSSLVVFIAMSLCTIGCDRISRVVPFEPSQSATTDSDATNSAEPPALEASSPAQNSDSDSDRHPIKSHGDIVTDPAIVPVTTGVVKQITDLLDRGKTEAARTLLEANEIRFAGDGMFQLQYARWLALTADVLSDPDNRSEDETANVQKMRQRCRAAVEFDENIQRYAGTVMTKATLSNIRKRAAAGQPLFRSFNVLPWTMQTFPGCWANDFQQYATWNPGIVATIRDEMAELADVFLQNNSALSSIIAVYLSKQPLAIKMREAGVLNMNFSVLADRRSANAVVAQLSRVADECESDRIDIRTLLTGVAMSQELLGAEFDRRVDSRDADIIRIEKLLIASAPDDDRIRLANWFNNCAWRNCKSPKATPTQLRNAVTLVNNAFTVLPEYKPPTSEQATYQIAFDPTGQRIDLIEIMANAANTFGVALYRQEKSEEAIIQFQRAMAFERSTGLLQMMAALGGMELPQENRYLNPLCIALCKLRMGNTDESNSIFTKLPTPKNSTGTYTEFYAEAESELRAQDQ